MASTARHLRGDEPRSPPRPQPTAATSATARWIVNRFLIFRSRIAFAIGRIRRGGHVDDGRNLAPRHKLCQISQFSFSAFDLNATALSTPGRNRRHPPLRRQGGEVGCAVVRNFAPFRLIEPASTARSVSSPLRIEEIHRRTPSSLAACSTFGRPL